LLLIASILLASCSVENTVKKGDKFVALGEYYEASLQYKKAYQKTPAKEKANRAVRALKLADCYARINQTQKAIAAYKNAIRYGIDSLPVQDALAYQEKMAKIKKEPLSQYKVKRMDIFNSRRADYSPALFGDQYDRLYFTSTRNDAQGDELSGITGMKNGDIFYSEKDDKGKWLRPQTIESGLNSDADEGACTFSPDGSTMYLTQCTTDPASPRYAQIVTSKRADAAWSKPTLLEISKDTLSSFAHPAISPDGNWLYFVSDMPGGKGGLDIWRIRIGVGGLGGVENLGEPVNSSADEMFPSFRPNGDLYFSSKRESSMGGLDIYIASVNVKTHKFELSHPGYPLNSNGDDFGMTFEGVHNRGFFSSNRGDGRGCDHIYSFELPEKTQTITGWIYEMDGYELPSAQVYIIGNDGTNAHATVKSDGSFTYVAEPGTEYILLASCKGFLNAKSEIIVPDTVTVAHDYTLQFPLAPLNTPTLINNIFYDFGKATLRPESSAALDSLATMLTQNPNITIELSSHCDYRGSSEFNKTLSQKRAESVVNYLIAKGIATDRMTPVGYGKESPKIVNKKAAKRFPWLKVGDKLTEDYIKNLGDEKKQEACNELNRRTEFLVLRTTYNMFDEKGNLKNPPVKKQQQTENEDDSYLDLDF
ncbi:MAG: OmpA family protein, partial [Prevotella sp.]|nr:OmpA family protein [Prevotella sp.]MCF0192882.1 OmpA family protein [Prevotella sp.]